MKRMLRTTTRLATLLVAAAIVLSVNLAWAQQQSPPAKPEAKQSQPEAKQSQPEAKPSQPAPKSDAPKADDAKPAPSSEKKSDKPRGEAADKSEKTDKAPRAAEKRDADKAPRSDDRRRDADRRREQAPDERKSDAQARPDRTRRDADRSRDTRDTPDRSSRDRTDARRRDSADSKDDSRTARDSNRRGKQRSASDLGFSFSKEKSDKGLEVTNISSQSIASKADFEEGDIIISVNDHRVTTHDEFVRWLFVDTDERITIIVLRDDREVTLYLEPEVIFEETTVAQGGWLGVDLYERHRQAAIVQRIHPDSPAERAGLRADDMILTVDGEPIDSPQHLGQVIGGMAPGSQVEIEVDRNRQTRVVDATLGRKEEVTRRTEIRRR